MKEQKEALQAAMALLREQVASDKTRIEFMETTIAAGGDNSKALTEEVKRLESARQLERDSREACERELAGVRREAEDLALNKKDLETRLEASRAEAGMMKSREEDLERRLDETTKAGSAASVANAELKGELSTLQASYRALELSSGRLAPPRRTLRPGRRLRGLCDEEGRRASPPDSGLLRATWTRRTLAGCGGDRPPRSVATG